MLKEYHKECYLILTNHLDLILHRHQKIVLQVEYHRLIPMPLLEKIYHLRLKQIVELLVLDHTLQLDLHYKHLHLHQMYYFLVLRLLLHHQDFLEADLLEVYYQHLLHFLFLIFLHSLIPHFHQQLELNPNLLHRQHLLLF